MTNKTNNPLIVHSIIVESTVNYITGKFTVSGCDGTNPTTTYSSNGGKTITLNCGNQTISEEGHAVFYVSVPKVTDEVFHFSVNAKTVVSETTTKYTFAKDSRTLTIGNSQLVSISVATDDAAVSTNANFWGKGNSSYPYLITDYADLKTLSDLVSNSGNDETYNASGIFYRQTDDFTITDANWGTSSRLAVGSTTNAFKANYDGSGHTVTLGVTSAGGSSYPVGIFGVLGDGAAVSKLNATGSISISTAKSHVGGIVGMVTGGVNISNSNSSVVLTSTADTYDYGVGGICGYVNADGYTVNISDCDNTGTISVYGLRAGGILGMHNDGTLNITNCNNSGPISQTKQSNTVYSGGIAGLINTGTETATFTNCTNESLGTVTGYCNVGGIIGKTGMPTVLSSCNNHATVASYTSGSSYRFNIGGMIGLADASLELHGTNNQTGNVGGFYFVGGVIGQNTAGMTVKKGAILNVGEEDKSISVKYWGRYPGSNSDYELPVYGTTTKVKNSSAAGGVVGRSKELTIDGAVVVYASVLENATQYACVGGVVGAMWYNAGGGVFTVSSTGSISSHVSISGTDNIGGIVGAGLEITIKGRVENYGSVSGTNRVGGVIGFAGHLDVDIDGGIGNPTCNHSIVDASGSYVGGIVGYTNANNVTLKHCSNDNSIKGTYGVGGIIGYNFPQNASSTTGKLTKIYYCSNHAQVTATVSGQSSGVGGIVGEVEQAKSYRVYNCCNLYKAGTSVKTTGTGTSLGVGGIVGHSDCNGSIFNCYNTGNLYSETSSRSIGGICGTIWEKGDTISNCFHKGTISGIATYASGTIGYLYRSAKDVCSYINNCYSSDVLSGVTATKSGILYGTTAKCTTYVYNCYAPHDDGENNINLFNGTANIKPYRCETLVMSAGVPTGSLSSAVGVAAQNNSATPGSGTYSTLSEALRAWQSTNTTSSPLGWPFLSWNMDVLPVFE